jgi:phospholipase/carboxylesterase
VIGKPALIVHGEHDQKLGVNLARWARGQLEQLGITLSYRELPIGHELTHQSVNLASTWLTAQLGGGANPPERTDDRVESAV